MCKNGRTQLGTQITKYRDISINQPGMYCIHMSTEFMHAMWSYLARWLLVVVAAGEPSSALGEPSIYLRVDGEPNSTYEAFAAASPSTCGVRCRNAGCRVWSWAPQEKLCSFHDSFLPSSFLSPQVGVQTFVAAVSMRGFLYVLLDVGAQTWLEARDLCLKVKGILTYIEDTEWMLSVLGFYGTDGFYLGLKKDPDNELWLDQQGQIFENSSIPWGPGEPDEGESCTAMWPTIGDVYCESMFALPSLCMITE
ncbi:uncharacterized protein LOC125048326 [Penaeus chinensis]|uniref:uncharacterized protein LOC125048326 n=1 Tax=Penaeus chinensis TaxID=139456 RepID=UPI001FB80BED|nr:uncharacterized protein LOC125048326 [Penaeus chinensis]